MPVVITDKTNKVWATEDPVTNYILVGWSGKSGVKLIEVMDFLDNHPRQWKAYFKKKTKSVSIPTPVLEVKSGE